jgi:hypothetical protein
LNAIVELPAKAAAPSRGAAGGECDAAGGELDVIVQQVTSSPVNWHVKWDGARKKMF